LWNQSHGQAGKCRCKPRDDPYPSLYLTLHCLLPCIRPPRPA
jgi:hypothetical protein